MNHSLFQPAQFVLNLLVSSPGILRIYSPLLIVLTVIGTAVPFATGAFIDAIACRRPPWTAFGILAGLIFLKTILSPVLQRFICSRSRKLEADLQFLVLDAAMSLPPAKLATVSDGELWFLELNPNGQWAWLDEDNLDGLISAIAETMISDDRRHLQTAAAHRTFL